ncbi:GTPase [Microcystis aeruginosa]|uniref:tRNA modification GTPase MnmE n=1 Tax=Microcystis aeruginosa NIES-2521 TaxID=2303983 RepID=A0A5A5RY29_MICAE|nr:GTPase [Microcystis aeruginosa]GCA78141.1 tRNA modification GTPase MnmE [Microcystis aeruginosa NIES-2521]
MELTQEERKAIEEVFSKLIEKAVKRPLTFLEVGRTGVGKSSTINTLIGRDVAEVGHLTATTMEVKTYNLAINDIKIQLIDTPGLCDDLEEKGNDLVYIDRIKKGVPNQEIDLVLFFSSLMADERSVLKDEKRAIRIISEAFGKKIWEQSVIVFTCACSRNIVLYEYQNDLKEWTKILKKEIKEYAGEDIAEQIPSVAVDNNSETTPDGQRWLGNLYTTSIQRISDLGFLQWVIATEERLVYSSNSSRTSSSSSSSTYYSSGYSDYSYYDSDYSSHSNSRAEKNKIILSEDNQNELVGKSENFLGKAVKTVKKGWDLAKPIIVPIVKVIAESYIKEKARDYVVEKTEKTIDYAVQKTVEVGSAAISSVGRGIVSVGRFFGNLFR